MSAGLSQPPEEKRKCPNVRKVGFLGDTDPRITLIRQTSVFALT
jgi:hypothetical protein